MAIQNGNFVKIYNDNFYFKISEQLLLIFVNLCKNLYIRFISICVEVRVKWQFSRHFLLKKH